MNTTATAATTAKTPATIAPAKARKPQRRMARPAPGDAEGGAPPVTDEMWLSGVRKSYAGEAVVGRDLLEV